MKDHNIKAGNYKKSEEIKLKEIKHEIIKDLSEYINFYDATDIGNLIGFIFSSYYENEELKEVIYSFIGGMNHGISLNNGTHSGDGDPNLIKLKT